MGVFLKGFDTPPQLQTCLELISQTKLSEISLHSHGSGTTGSIWKTKAIADDLRQVGWERC